MEDVLCSECKSLKFDSWRSTCYCNKIGINISGTLERLEKCKKENLKEV